MKRIAAHIGLSSFCALAVAFYLPETAVIILMSAAAALAVVFLLIRKTRKTVILPAVAAVVALSCGANLLYAAAAVKPAVERFCGEDRRIEATLTDEPYLQYSKYCYPLTTDTVDGEEARVRILLRSNHALNVDPFDTLTFTADIIPTVNQYLLAKGYYVTVDAYTVSYTAHEDTDRPLYYYAIRLRQAMRGAIDACLPAQEASLCKAVLIGDKYALDQSVKDDFRYSGVSHYVVVSGLHFSIICMMGFLLFKKLFRKRFIYFPLTYLLVVLYMTLTGFQPSVMRAGVMMLILLTGRLIRRMNDPLTSLGIAGLAMPIIFSPYGCGDIGMILSFAATFSIIMWQTPLYEKLRIKSPGNNILKRAVNGLLSMISVCLAANILVFPLSVFLFNGFSLMTLLSSLLLYFPIYGIIFLSLAVCVLYYLGPLRWVALLAAYPLCWLSRLTLWLVKVISGIPFAYIHVSSAYFYLWVAVTLALGLTAYCLRRRYRMLPWVALISAILFFGGMTLNTAVQLNTNVLEYYAAERGATVYLNRGGFVHVLRFDCDSDSAYRMLNHLTDTFGGVQTAVSTSTREHVNYNRFSAREFPVAHFLTYCGVDGVDPAASPDILFGGESEFILDSGVVLRTVEYKEKSLLYLIDGDRTVMLIPAAFPAKAIPESMRCADVIVLHKRKGYDYSNISCDTLILTSACDQPDQLPQHADCRDPSDGSVRLNMN